MPTKARNCIVAYKNIWRTIFGINKQVTLLEESHKYLQTVEQSLKTGGEVLWMGQETIYFALSFLVSFT